MPRLKTALITLILTLIFVDWIKLKTERQLIDSEVRRSIGLVEKSQGDVTFCISTLTICKDELGSQVKRAQLLSLTQSRVISLVKAAQAGDRDANVKLAELGWAWDLKRRVLQASVAEE